jgi:hypothetical protein
MHPLSGPGYEKPVAILGDEDQVVIAEGNCQRGCSSSTLIQQNPGKHIMIDIATGSHQAHTFSLKGVLLLEGRRQPGRACSFY